MSDLVGYLICALALGYVVRQTLRCHRDPGTCWMHRDTAHNDGGRDE